MTNCWCGNPELYAGDGTPLRTRALCSTVCRAMSTSVDTAAQVAAAVTTAAADATTKANAAQAAAIAAAATDATTKANAAQAAAIAASQPLFPASYLTAATTRTLASYAGTGLSVSVAAGKNYKITAAGQYRTAALTTGIGFRLGGTATATGVRYQTVIQGLTATTNTIQAQSALGVTATFSTAVAAINADFGWQIDGFIRVATAGTITVDFATEVANSTVTVQPDAYLLLEQVT